MERKVNPFVLVFIVVVGTVIGYFSLKYVYRTEVSTEQRSEIATVVRTYSVEGHSTLEDKTYYVELKTASGDKLTAEGTVYYSVCKNKQGGQVTVTYLVKTYSDGTKKIIIQDVANVNSGHKQ